MQLPIHEDNPLSPGYSEPLCVSFTFQSEIHDVAHNSVAPWLEIRARIVY